MHTRESIEDAINEHTADGFFVVAGKVHDGWTSYNVYKRGSDHTFGPCLISCDVGEDEIVVRGREAEALWEGNYANFVRYIRSKPE